MVIKISDESFKKYLISFFLLVFSIVSLYNLKLFPTVLYDEPMYANTAYSFSNNFKFFNYLTGYSGQEFFLYPGVVGPLLKFIPSTLYGFRKINILFGLVSVFLFSNLCIKTLKSRIVIVGTVASFVFSNIVFIAHRIVRPESLALMFCLFALFFATTYVGLLRHKHVFLLGLSLSLFSLIHPICIIFYLSFMVGWMFLLFKNRILARSLVPFILGHLPSALLVILYFRFWSIYAPVEWVGAVFGNDRIPGVSVLNGFFTNIAWIYEGYMMGAKRALLVGIECVVIGWGICQLRRNQFAFFLSLITLLYFSILLLVFQPLLRPYYTLLIPAVILLMGLFVDSLRIKCPRIVLLLFIYAGYSLSGNAFLLWMNRGNEDYSKLKKNLVSVLPPYDHLFVDRHYFWFWFKDEAQYGTDLLSKDNVPNGTSLYILNDNSEFNSRASNLGGVSRIPIPESNFKKGNSTGEYSLIETINSKSYGKFEVWRIIK